MKDWFVLPPSNVINNCLASHLNSTIADGSRAGEFFNTIRRRRPIVHRAEIGSGG